MNSNQLRKIVNGHYFVIEVMFGKGRGKAHTTTEMNSKQIRKQKIVIILLRVAVMLLCPV